MDGWLVGLLCLLLEMCLTSLSLNFPVTCRGGESKKEKNQLLLIESCFLYFEDGRYRTTGVFSSPICYSHCIFQQKHQQHVLRIIICFKRSTFVASLETTCLHWTACLMNRCFFLQCIAMPSEGKPETSCM